MSLSVKVRVSQVDLFRHFGLYTEVRHSYAGVEVDYGSPS